MERIIINSFLLAHLICKHPITTKTYLTIFRTFSVPLVSFIWNIHLIQRHDMICKSCLIAKHTVFVFLYFIIPNEKCLIFTRFIEVVYVRDVIVMVAAVIYVRVYQCGECILRNESLLRSIDCTEDLRSWCLILFWIQLYMATFLIFTGVSLIQFFTDQFLQLTITILAI